MEKALKGANIVDIAKQYPLEPQLQKIFNAGIVKKDDLLLLKHFSQYLKGSPYTDSVGKEISVNKFPVDLFIPNKSKKRYYDLQQGIAFAVSLAEKLRNEFADFSCKIIVEIDEGEDSFPEVCKVGFHVSRPNEHWLNDNLESYKMNGLLVIET